MDARLCVRRNAGGAGGQDEEEGAHAAVPRLHHPQQASAGRAGAAALPLSARGAAPSGCCSCPAVASRMHILSNACLANCHQLRPTAGRCAHWQPVRDFSSVLPQSRQATNKLLTMQAPEDGAPSSASEQAAEPLLMELDAQPSAAADQAGTGAEQRPPAVADQAGEASEQPPEQPPPQPPRPKQQPPKQQPRGQRPSEQRPSEQRQPAQPSSSAVASPEPGAEAAIEAEAAPGAEAAAAAQPEPGAEAAGEAEAVPGAEAEAATADPGAGAKRSGAGAEGGAPAVDHGSIAAERPASPPAAATADAAVNDAASSEEPPEQRPAAPDSPRQ